MSCCIVQSSESSNLCDKVHCCFSVAGWIVLLGGCRKVSIKDFFVNEKNCLQLDEVIVSIEIPFINEV